MGVKIRGLTAQLAQQLSNAAGEFVPRRYEPKPKLGRRTKANFVWNGRTCLARPVIRKTLF
jgi:hypothetical protein